jgi:hypothetical protein
MPPRGKRKRVHTQIHTNIPLDGDVVVTHVEVTRDTKQRILAQSTRVSIPITDLPPSQDASPQASDPLLSSDEPTGPATKKARKGPSRSVAVRPHAHYRPLRCIY